MTHFLRSPCRVPRRIPRTAAARALAQAAHYSRIEDADRAANATRRPLHRFQTAGRGGGNAGPPLALRFPRTHHRAALAPPPPPAPPPSPPIPHTPPPPPPAHPPPPLP